MSAPLTTTYNDLVMNEIDRFFRESGADAIRIDKSYEQLWKNLERVFRAGGKRLRSRMLLSSYEAFGGRDVASISAVAAAQELLHFALLIHDDVIDRDYIRYGVANIAGAYKTDYSRYVLNDADVTHYAHGTAILGGDLMLSGAHQLIANSQLSDTLRRIASRYLSQAVYHVAGGELLDSELSFRPYSPGDALTVARFKTASYSFETPLGCGAALAGASPEQLSRMSVFAQSLGIAYQLVDDIIGTYGDEALTGKSSVSDIIEGKRTYMVEQAMHAMTAEEKTLFMMGFGNPDATTLEIEQVRHLLESSGAKAKTQLLVTQYADEARHALDTLDIDEHGRNELKTLIRTVTDRQR